MSYVLFGFVVAVGIFGLIQFLWAMRGVLFGSGFKSTADMLLMIFLVAVSAVLVLWLGPIALAGVGLL